MPVSTAGHKSIKLLAKQTTFLTIKLDLYSLGPTHFDILKLRFMTVRPTVGKYSLICNIVAEYLADTFVPGVSVSGRFCSVICSLLCTQKVQLNMESSLMYLVWLL